MILVVDVIGADLAAKRPDRYGPAGRVVRSKGPCRLCGADDGTCTSRDHQEAMAVAEKKAAAKQAAAKQAAPRKKASDGPAPLPDGLDWFDEQAGLVRVRETITQETVRAGFKRPTSIQVIPAGRVLPLTEVQRLKAAYGIDDDRSGDKRAEAPAEVK